ncbi:MAG: dihydrodipicolinate reductase [Frankiales bacterium]|nr:dihydrodipicolinate reductase [Frankiales bacterium]
MVFRVVQWATGGVGRASIEGILRHQDLELVGCRVYSADKRGRDVGELVGGAPLGVLATDSLEEILALDADCVVYAPLVADDDEVAALLRSGKNVVTPVGWIYPDRTRPRSVAIEEACQEGKATLHGTGIHPGGITERFPLMLSALTSAVTKVRAEEFSDIRTYGAPDVVRDIMGFGGTPEQALQSPMLSLLGAGFKASMRMVVDELGFAAEPALRSTQEVAVATAPIDSPIGVIEPGHVAARRFVWEALVDGEPVVTASVNWLMGEEHLDPAWSFGAQGERFEVEVQGDPSVQMVFTGLHPESVAAGLERNAGVVSTANHCVSAIPYVCQAEPGIKTYLELPLIAGRAARELGRGAGR